MLINPKMIVIDSAIFNFVFNSTGSLDRVLLAERLLYQSTVPLSSSIESDFVCFYPINERLEASLIHDGDTAKARELIDWLEALKLPATVFYWSVSPKQKGHTFTLGR